jgi:hypothetical protein
LELLLPALDRARKDLFGGQRENPFVGSEWRPRRRKCGIKAGAVSRLALVPVERITRAILVIRGHKILLDSDLASLYGVETKALVQAVKRNLSRFPADFAFQLSEDEFQRLRSQTVTSKQGRGGRRTPPYAFTEQGVAMLSSVLRSERAVAVNVEIMRAFVHLRQMLESHVELAKKLDALEKRYDAKFKLVFDAIRELMAQPVARTKPIGFRKQ